MLAPLQLLASQATAAYGRAASTDTATPAGGGFGDMLQSALDGVVSSGHAADAETVRAAQGGGNITEVVSAVSKAELTLQTTVAVRDRVVQAYQEIMRMPI